MRKTAPLKRLDRASTGEPVEWVGGVLALPSYVTEGDEPYRPAVAFWVELPAGLVVAAVVAHPANEHALSEALQQALERPTKRAARAPGRLRVADPEGAAELRRVFADRFPIDVAPTPELDVVLEGFLEHQSSAGGLDGRSYLEGGRVTEPTVARMFRAASALFRVAPWKVASDTDVLRMDIPALGLEGACVAILGAADQSFGFLLFQSLAHYHRFAEAADEQEAGLPIDLGGPVLSLDFDHTRNLSPSQRREIASHHWQTVAPEAIPCITHRDRDGVPRPIRERDVRIVTECAFALAPFFLRHRAAFERRSRVPVSESSTMGDTKVTVRLTFPYDAANAFEEQSPPSAGRPLGGQPGPVAPAKTGRNDPCPCGSGKKHKKCCLDKVPATQLTERRRATAQVLEEGMVTTLQAFGHSFFGAAWLTVRRKIERAAGNGPMSTQIAVPWLVYEATIDGERIVDAFLRECGGLIPDEHRQWLLAEQRAHFDIWEVTSTEPGVAVSLRGLIFGKARRVQERVGSRSVVAREAVLARVVDYEGASYFGGMSPRALPLAAAERVAQRAKRQAEKAGATRLDDRAGLTLVRAWTKAVADKQTTETGSREPLDVGV